MVYLFNSAPRQFVVAAAAGLLFVHCKVREQEDMARVDGGQDILLIGQIEDELLVLGLSRPVNEFILVDLGSTYVWSSAGMKIIAGGFEDHGKVNS